MKTFLEISVPVIGRAQLEKPLEIHNGDIRVKLDINENHVLTRASICSQIISDEIPEITPGDESVALHIYERESLTNSMLEARLRSLEGILTTSGVERFDFTRTSRKWFRALALGEDEEIIFGYESDHREKPLSNVHLPVDYTTYLIGVSLNPNNDSLSLSLLLFRRGWEQYCNFNYIEAIWYFSFFIEHSFAQGKIKTAHQKAAYCASSEMRSAFIAAKNSINDEVRRGDISKHDADKLLVSINFETFSGWLVNLRGEMLHQSSRRTKTWHPSNAIERKRDATVLATFCSEAALQIPLMWEEK